MSASRIINDADAMSRTPASLARSNGVYSVWRNMRIRCTDPTCAAWTNYGGRGITVCDRWTGDNGLENFMNDMGPRPVKFTLERLDNNAGYSPENCCWASQRQNARNRRVNVYVTFQGQTRLLIEFAEIAGLPYRTVWTRINRDGWSLADALTRPLRQLYQYQNFVGTYAELARAIGMPLTTFHRKAMQLGVRELSTEEMAAHSQARKYTPRNQLLPGTTLTLKSAAKRYKINYKTLWHRVMVQKIPLDLAVSDSSA